MSTPYLNWQNVSERAREIAGDPAYAAVLRRELEHHRRRFGAAIETSERCRLIRVALGEAEPLGLLERDRLIRLEAARDPTLHARARALAQRPPARARGRGPRTLPARSGLAPAAKPARGTPWPPAVDPAARRGGEGRPGQGRAPGAKPGAPREPYRSVFAPGGGGAYGRWLRSLSAAEQRDVRATAFHEGGHAVAAYVLGAGVARVAIERRGVRAAPLEAVAGACMTRRECRDVPVYFLAGTEAQAEAGFGQCAEAELQVDLDGARVAIRRDPARWGYGGVEGGIAAARVQARDLVRRHWRAVSAVAAALLETGALAGEDAERRIAEALRR